MRKLIVVIIALFCVSILSVNCFAESKNDNSIAKEIYQKIVSDRELSNACIKSAKGVPNKLISIKELNLGEEDDNVEGYEVKASSRACCGGEASCPTFIYKKDGDELSKVFGPQLTKEIFFLDGTGGMGLRGFALTYVGGNHAIKSVEYYAFDQNAYKQIAGFERRINGDAINSISLSTNEVAKKIAKIMIKNNELPKACVQKSKGDHLEMFDIERIQIGIEKIPTEAFKIESKGECFMGARRAAVWIYKKNIENDNFVKIFGPEYPDEIVFKSEEEHYDGYRQMIVRYPAGNSYPGTEELYLFNSNRYQKVGEQQR